MFFAAFVAGVGEGVVDAEFLAAEGDVAFGDVAVGGDDADAVVGAGPGRTVEGFHEFGTAVGVDGMVAGVVRDHDGVQVAAFGQARGDGEHNAIAERDDSGFHVVIGIGALGDLASGEEEVAAEVFADEIEGYDQVGNAEDAAILFRTGDFPGVVLRTVVEGDGQSDALLVLVQECRAVQPAGVNKYGFHSFQNNFQI